MGHGYERAFPSDGLKLAVTESLNEMSKRHDKHPNSLRVDQVFDAMITAWRRIGTDPPQTMPKESGDEHQKAMIACAKAAVEEVLLKSQPPKRYESEQEEIARLKRENADLRNTQNQLRDQVESLKERVPLRQVQGTRGRGMPPKSYGGYGRDTRRQPYKGKPSEAEHSEDKRERGYRVNVSGQQFARFARIRIAEVPSEAICDVEMGPVEPLSKGVDEPTMIMTRSRSKRPSHDISREAVEEENMADDFSGHGENEEVFPDAPKLRKASQEGIAQDMLETNMPVLRTRPPGWEYTSRSRPSVEIP